MPTEGRVSCCSCEGPDVTGVFAMPYSGLCPNVGRLGIRQKRVRLEISGRLCRRKPTTTRSRTPGISGFREVDARWTSYRVNNHIGNNLLAIRRRTILYPLNRVLQAYVGRELSLGTSAR